MFILFPKTIFGLAKPSADRQGFFQQFLGMAHGPTWGKNDRLGEINGIEHNKGSKIYPQKQVILGCIMSSIPLKHKRLSIILIWAIVSHK